MLKLSSCWSHKEELLCLLGKNHEKETIMNNERKLRELSVEKSLDDLIAVQVNDPSSKTDGYMAGLSNGLLLAKSLFGHEYHPISYKTLTTPIEYGKIPIPTPVIEYNEKVGILAELEQLQKEKEELEREVEELEDELNTIREQIKGPSLHPEVTGVAVIDDIRDMQRDYNKLTKKVSTQSSQIKELVGYFEEIIKLGDLPHCTCGSTNHSAKEALARYKDGSK